MGGNPYANCLDLLCIYLLVKFIYAYICLGTLLVMAIYMYFCLGELPELAQTLVYKKHGSRPMKLGRVSLLQSSAPRSQFWLPELPELVQVLIPKKIVFAQ